MENVKNNPSLTGLHVPTVAALLKTGRTVPGILVIAILLLALAARKRLRPVAEAWDHGKILFVSGMVGALLVVGGCLSCVTANWIHVANYLQPLLAGLFLALVARHFS